MKRIAISFLAFLAISLPAYSQECEQSHEGGDCSRYNENYRHRKWRSQKEPYYQLHNRAQSKREGFHERAESMHHSRAKSQRN